MSKASALYVLHEAASGYALFDVVELDEVASLTPELQAAIKAINPSADDATIEAMLTVGDADGARRARGNTATRRGPPCNENGIRCGERRGEAGI